MIRGNRDARPTQQYWGKYMGFCRDNNDPRMVGRIRVEVPDVYGGTGPDSWSVWAWPSFPPGNFNPPAEGAGVWVEFLQGDPNRPVWTGIWYSGDGADAVYPTTAPFQAVHPKLTDFTGADAEPDLDHVESKDPVSNADHTVKGYHDHKTTFYTPHRRTWISPSGHYIELNDHPGLGGYTTFRDRFGRLLEMTARGITRLKSYVRSVADGGWHDLNNNPAEGYAHLIFADYLNNPDATDTSAPQTLGQYVELRSMSASRLLFTDTAGSEQTTLEDFWGQHFRLHTVKNAEYVEIIDKLGQKLKFDVATGTVRVDDHNGNYILMAAGKITVSVQTGSHVYVGGEGGQTLATKEFVQDHFNTHTHVSSMPGSPTSPPIIPSPLIEGTDITKKTVAE